jgi:hypothetical protein
MLNMVGYNFITFCIRHDKRLNRLLQCMYQLFDTYRFVMLFLLFVLLKRSDYDGKFCLWNFEFYPLFLSR